MKKSILFTAIIGAFLLMTSCLGEVNNSFTDQLVYVYIDTDNSGTVIGKTIPDENQRPPSTSLITANEMQMMSHGTIKIMSYSWEEENGTKTINIDNNVYQAHYVNLIDQTIDVNTTNLKIMEIPEVEAPLSFLEFASPILLTTEFIGNYFIFHYYYEVPKGQTGDVQFYKRDQTVENSNDIIIDVHLTHNGTPTGTTNERKLDFKALDMSVLRSQYLNTDIKELKIKFVYHQKDRSDPIVSQSYTMILKMD